jgi:Cysteine rich repeat
MMTQLVLRKGGGGGLLLSAVLLMALSAPAFAQAPSQAQAAAIRQACRADYQAHCASVPTGGSAALNCLQQNVTSLSAPCRQAVTAVGGAASSASTAPASAGAAPVQPAPAAAPQAAHPPMSPREQAMLLRQACGFDFRRYCSGVPFGGGRVISCLEGNADRLSPRCGTTLQAMRRSR